MRSRAQLRAIFAAMRKRGLHPSTQTIWENYPGRHFVRTILNRRDVKTNKGWGSEVSYSVPMTSSTSYTTISTPVTHAELPDILYHVTPHLSGIRHEGVLIAATGMKSGGLGGEARPGVSFTTNKADALLIKRDFLRLARAMRDGVTTDQIRDMATRDAKLAGIPTDELLSRLRIANRYTGEPIDLTTHNRWTGKDAFYAIESYFSQRGYAAQDIAYRSTVRQVQPIEDAGIRRRIAAEVVADIKKRAGAGLASSERERVIQYLRTFFKTKGPNMLWALAEQPYNVPITKIGKKLGVQLVDERMTNNPEGEAKAARVRAVLKNPQFMSTPESYAKLNPKHVRIIAVPKRLIPKDTLITRGSDDYLGEIRVHGDVPITGAYSVGGKKMRQFGGRLGAIRSALAS